MKVALYARVSDPREKRDTIDFQIDALRAHARATHVDVAESYPQCDNRLWSPCRLSPRMPALNAPRPAIR